MLWLLLTHLALAHPGADAHAHRGCDDIPAVLRHAQALTTEDRFDEAKAAIAQAVRCGADPTDTDLATATLLLTTGRPADALPVLDRAVNRRPTPPVMIARADALEALGRHAEAAADRLDAIQRADRVQPGPDLWVGAARALAAAGRPTEALATVDRGLQATGPVPALVRAGVELAERTDPDEALRRLDGVPRSPVWLELRGEVLARAGRVAEARAVLEEALAEMRSGRPSRRTDEQIARLQSTLNDLEAR